MNLIISYQTQLLPPPYAYAMVLNLDLCSNIIKGQLEIEYLGRESLTLEQLKAEGFTENDDYSWKGVIDYCWKDDVELLATLETNNEPDNEIYLHLMVDNCDVGFPRQIAKADLIFQELIQAILEADKIEEALIIVLRIDDIEHEFSWEFSKRQFLKNRKPFKSWDWGRDFMKKVYSVDFESKHPMKKISSNCIQIGGLWYELTKDLKVRFSELVGGL